MSSLFVTHGGIYNLNEFTAAKSKARIFEYHATALRSALTYVTNGRKEPESAIILDLLAHQNCAEIPIETRTIFFNELRAELEQVGLQDTLLVRVDKQSCQFNLFDAERAFALFSAPVVTNATNDEAKKPSYRILPLDWAKHVMFNTHNRYLSSVLTPIAKLLTAAEQNWHQNSSVNVCIGRHVDNVKKLKYYMYAIRTLVTNYNPKNCIASIVKFEPATGLFGSNKTVTTDTPFSSRQDVETIFAELQTAIEANHEVNIIIDFENL